MPATLDSLKKNWTAPDSQGGYWVNKVAFEYYDDSNRLVVVPEGVSRPQDDALALEANRPN